MDIEECRLDAPLAGTTAILERSSAGLQLARIGGLDRLRQLHHPASLPAGVAVACLAAGCVPYRREHAVEGLDVVGEMVMVVMSGALLGGGTGAADGEGCEKGSHGKGAGSDHGRVQ